MRCMSARQTYMEQLQNGGSSMGGLNWEDVVSGGARSRQAAEEAFYGFGDFFRDLDKDRCAKAIPLPCRKHEHLAATTASWRCTFGSGGAWWGPGALTACLEKSSENCCRKERQKRKGKEQPMSLWEEIADIGEEFVEFLEKETGLSSAEVPQSCPLGCTQ